MNFNKHYNLEGKHAFLTPSQSSWVNYSEEKLIDRWASAKAVEEGTRMHKLAKDCIDAKLKVARTAQTINMYINDAIGYDMATEVCLYYSDNCFGHADAIRYFEKQKLLRIHDLKTGVTPASMDQLRIYDALFFLEYGSQLGITPFNTKIENRIYQFNNIAMDIPEPEKIQNLMELIIKDDIIINKEKGVY